MDVELWLRFPVAITVDRTVGDRLTSGDGELGLVHGWNTGIGWEAVIHPAARVR